jgi:hypothetical protein
LRRLPEIVYARQILGWAVSPQHRAELTRIGFLPWGTLLLVLLASAAVALLLRLRFSRGCPAAWPLAVGLVALGGPVLGVLAAAPFTRRVSNPLRPRAAALRWIGAVL